VGYELWTSPIYGYRRKGTRLADLRRVIEDGITARAILEPLQSCRAQSSAQEAKETLKRRDFDVAGVKESENGPVIGWVSQEVLDGGLVMDRARPILVDNLLSDATPLPQVLEVLRAQAHAFVLVGSKVAGIVTRADLNKPPVRVYLFGLVSLLEMHLSFWIRNEYGEDSWQGHLSKKRLEKAMRTQQLRRRRNQNPYLAQCIQFCDKRDLVIRLSSVRKTLSLGSEKQAATFLQRVENLRNGLAHGQYDLAEGLTWEETIGLVEKMDEVIRMSDDYVEKKVQTAPRRHSDELWAST
jgi:hypothetical protein